MVASQQSAPEQTEAVWPFAREQPFDPPAELTRRREVCSVSKVLMYDGGSGWLVTRYDDVRTVLGSPDFSSVETWPWQPSASRAAAERGETSFTAMDPPEHTFFRKLLTRHFTVKRVAQHREAVEAIVREVLDTFVTAEQPADLVRGVAYPIATRAMCHVIGVPYADHEWFEHRAEVRSVITADADEAAQATQDLLDYVERLIDLRLESPGDDLISTLTHELLVPGIVERADLVAMIRLLLTAGHETTATMIGTGTQVLLSHPEQWQQLTSDRSLMPGAIEELLRYISMLHITVVRRAKVDTEVGGCPIAAGEGMLANPAAANKDPRAFDDPDRFDITRDARHHVAFGFGVHQCLGQNLARLELAAAYGAILDRLPNLRVADVPDAVTHNDSNLVGVSRLMVTW